MVEESDPLAPNRERDGRPALDRRRFLAGTAAAGAAATAGCAGDDGDTATATVTEAPTVLVFNTGDQSVSVVNAEDDEVVETVQTGATSSFPSNQFTPDLVASGEEHFWGNVDQGVSALDARDLTEAAAVETGTGRNWQERTPDGEALVVSAREPAHTQYKVDAAPDSDTFGEVLAELDRTDEGGRGDNEGPGPCDVSVHPDGEYAYVPDLYGDTITVLDVAAFEIVTQVPVEPEDGPAKPWMGTVAPGGDYLLVEHQPDIETVWDISDPAEPVEVARLTPADGLGRGPLTSEVSDDDVGFVFTRSSEDVTVVDLAGGEVLTRIDVGGAAFTGTWDPGRSALYVPVRSTDSVAVLDPEERAVSTTIDVGPNPYGATAGRVRPDPRPRGTTAAALARLGLATSGTSYCIGECACGHDPDGG